MMTKDNTAMKDNWKETSNRLSGFITSTITAAKDRALSDADLRRSNKAMLPTDNMMAARTTLTGMPTNTTKHHSTNSVSQ